MRYCLAFIYFLLFFEVNSQNLEWANSVGSSNHDSYNGIYLTMNNNIVSYGSYSSSIDLDPGNGIVTHNFSGGNDDFIQCLDSDGNYKWSKSFGNPNSGIRIIDVAEDKFGNLYFTGNFQGTIDFDPGINTFNLTAVNARDYFVLKLDSNANFIWAKSMGGSQNDEGTSIVVDNDLNIFITGLFSSTVDFDPDTGVYLLSSNGLYDAFIQKLDSMGSLVWVYSFGGGYVDHGNTISITKSNKIIVSGVYHSSQADFSNGGGVDTLSGFGVFILEIDTSSSFQWVKGIKGVINVSDVAIDLNDNIYITGFFGMNNNQGGDVVDLDPGTGVQNETNVGEEDIYEMCLDKNGSLRWAYKLATNFNERAMSVEVDNLGKVYFTGSYEAPLDFDPGPGTNVLPNTSIFGQYPNKVYLHVMDTNGNHEWAVTFGDETAATAYVDLGLNNKVYVNGIYNGGNGDFDPNSGVFNLPSHGLQDGFILKLNSFPVSINGNHDYKKNNIYPNPTYGFVNIKSNELILSVDILNLAGKLIFTKKHSSHIDISSLNSGVYFLRITTEKQIFTEKIILN